MADMEDVEQLRLPGGEYAGDFVQGRMESKEPVEYKFENGTRYVGPFLNGCFHGEGVLHLPGKGSFAGTWEKGQLVRGEFTFEDGLAYEEKAEWEFCTARDRRFWEEHENGIKPSGATLLRRSDQTVPYGMYDCLEGYFDPRTGNVHSYANNVVIRTAGEEEAKMIRERAFAGLRLTDESKSA
ncbi:MORN repeat-containing protein 5 [Hondaea fermentalgiana]|uniref:MORN repeat-containing protein 5 n=1 Tax=Hondaea fermentalgiana TaxID=2315210 RepID=A0A2R5GE90_9STRA|nr:MORN repeat-containing protein 5 [Hondaea fermentalgiana]|eukprot:GBG26541.1 MORN repeat-containing protein 5 [Hondaea fermentalgiana]